VRSEDAAEMDDDFGSAERVSAVKPKRSNEFDDEFDEEFQDDEHVEVILPEKASNYDDGVLLNGGGNILIRFCHS